MRGCGRPVLAADDVVGIEEQVDVDDARLPLEPADPAQFAFDFQQAVQQGVGAERGADFGGCVEVGGRIGRAADGRVLAKR